MVELTVYTKDSAPEASRSTLQSVEERFGFIPNVLGQLAEEPVALHGAFQLLGLLSQSTLTAEEQSIVLLTVAYQNHSDYCVAANSAVAQTSQVPDEVIHAVRDGAALTDPKLEALRLLALEMVRERGRVSDATIRRFFDAGYTKGQLLAVVLGVATETIASYTDRVSGVPMDEPFRAWAWSAPNAAASS